jgi:hypothetical protein
MKDKADSLPNPLINHPLELPLSTNHQQELTLPPMDSEDHMSLQALLENLSENHLP